MKLNQYKGLKVTKAVHKVTEAEVAGQMEMIRQQNQKKVTVTDRAAMNGDEVIIDYAGFVGEEQFQGGTAQKQPLTLGSGTFIPGFEEQLVGASIGDHVDVHVTFPTQYHAPELAGKEAVFRCVVHEIHAMEEAELNDDFAKRVAGLETFAMMQETLRQQMQAYADQMSARQMQDQMIQQLVAQCEEMEITEEQMDKEMQRAMRDIDMQLQQQGLNLESYLQYTGKTMEQFKEELKPDAEKNILMHMALNEVRRLENIQATEEEMEQEMAMFAAECGIPVEQLKTFTEEAGLEAVRNDVAIKKTIEFLMNHAELVEAV